MANALLISILILLVCQLSQGDDHYCPDAELAWDPLDGSISEQYFPFMGCSNMTDELKMHSQRKIYYEKLPVSYYYHEEDIFVNLGLVNFTSIKFKLAKFLNRSSMYFTYSAKALEIGDVDEENEHVKKVSNRYPNQTDKGEILGSGHLMWMDSITELKYIDFTDRILIPSLTFLRVAGKFGIKYTCEEYEHVKNDISCFLESGDIMLLYLGAELKYADFPDWTPIQHVKIRYHDQKDLGGCLDSANIIGLHFEGDINLDRKILRSKYVGEELPHFEVNKQLSIVIFIIAMWRLISSTNEPGNQSNSTGSVIPEVDKGKERHGSGVASAGPGRRPPCVLCCVRMCDTMVIPCSHLAMCKQCAVKRKVCPRCEKNILATCDVNVA